VDLESIVNTDNTVRERANTGRFASWLMLSGNRMVIAGLMNTLIFVAFTVGAVTLHPDLAQQLHSGALSERLFSTMITVIVTGATLVVGFGQVVLSQENGPLGDQRDRLDGAMEFRQRTAELTEKPSSTTPAIFLSDILGATSERAEAARTIHEAHDGALSDDVEELVDGIVRNASNVRQQLDGAEFGTFDVVFSSLNFDFSWKVFQIERIRSEYDETLTDDEHRMLVEMKTALMLYGPARQYIKSLYFQWSLIALSQLILFTALPALIVAATMFVVARGGTFSGATFGVENIVIVVGGALAVTLVPFTLFVSYIFRIFTIAKRTLAVDPLIPRETQ